MNLPIFEAIPRAYWEKQSVSVARPAYMSLHFSPTGAGFVNLPPPGFKGKMLIADDATPPAYANPEAAAAQLLQLSEAWEHPPVLLDWMRPPTADATEMLDAICTVCKPIVPPAYHRPGLPLFLPPIELHRKPADCLRPYLQNEIWLEAERQCRDYVVTREGCEIRGAHSAQPLAENRDYSCRYAIVKSEEAIVYHLERNRQDWEAMLNDAPVAGGVAIFGQL